MLKKGAGDGDGANARPIHFLGSGVQNVPNQIEVGVHIRRSLSRAIEVGQGA